MFCYDFNEYGLYIRFIFRMWEKNSFSNFVHIFMAQLIVYYIKTCFLQDDLSNHI